MFKVLKRKVTKAEAELLIKQIRLTPNIMGYCLKEWLEAEHIMVAEDENGNLAGACLNYVFSKDWNKIAALFVHEEFRGLGIGKFLFYESLTDAINRRNNVYIISSNPIIIKMMTNSGFSTFESLLEFLKKYKKYQLHFALHNMKWLLNLYRMQEIIRKKNVYKSQKPFVYGFKLL